MTGLDWLEGLIGLALDALAAAVLFLIDYGLPLALAACTIAVIVCRAMQRR